MREYRLQAYLARPSQVPVFDEEAAHRPLLPLAGRRHLPARPRSDRGASGRRPRCRHRLRFHHRRRLRGEAVRDLESSLKLGVRRTPMQRHIGPGDIASAYRTYKIIKQLQPDVVHGHGAKGGVYARLFGSLLRVSRSRVARLYSPHGGSLHYDEKTLTGQFFFMLERLMERFTDHLLFVSDYELRTFRRKIGAAADPQQPGLQWLAESRVRVGRSRCRRSRFPLHRHDARPQRSRPVHRRAGAGQPAGRAAAQRCDGRRRRRFAEVQGASGARSGLPSASSSIRRCRRGKPLRSPASSSFRRAPRRCPTSFWRRWPPECR